MRSPLTSSLSAIALCLATALPAAANPMGSSFNLFFDVVYDADLTTPNQDNTHAGMSGMSLLFQDPGPLNTQDLVYDSAGSQEGIDGYSLLLETSFTPNGAGGGVMSFLITNGNYPGEPMFPGVGADIDETHLDITFDSYADTVGDVSYLVDGVAGGDALPAIIWGEAPIDLGLEWFGSAELAGAQSIRVDVAIGPAAVPEPTSLALVGGVITALFGLRRRLG